MKEIYPMEQKNNGYQPVAKSSNQPQKFKDGFQPNKSVQPPPPKKPTPTPTKK